MAVNWQDAQRSEKEFWDGIYLPDAPGGASGYKPTNSEEAQRYLNRTLRRHGVVVGDFVGKSVMDLGCGPTGLIKGLAEYEGGGILDSMSGLFGMDPLMDAYKQYNLIRPHEKIHLIQAKGESIPLEGRSFDYIFCQNAIDHCENPRQVLAEVARLIKANGLFCPSVHVLYPIYEGIAPIFKYLDKNHPHHFTERKFVLWCKEHFSSVSVHTRMSVVEIFPDFRFSKIFQAPSLSRGLKRAAANYIVRTIFLNCRL